MAAPKGNQNAAKAKQWSAAIERALDKRALNRGGKTRAEALDELAESFLKACDDGNLVALKELADRLDGKAAQSMSISGDEENPLAFTEIVRKIVK